jgi:cytosine/uracil/thiamine/allantoin permease
MPRTAPIRYRWWLHLAAIGATLVGAAVALAGMFRAPLRPIHDGSWYVGSALVVGLSWV